MKLGFGIVGLPKRGGGPLVKPAPGAVITDQHPLAQGLVGYFPLNGADGRNIATAQGGTVVSTNVVSVGSERGLVASFPGTGAITYSGFGIPANSLLTVSFWANLRSRAGTLGYVGQSSGTEFILRHPTTGEYDFILNSLSTNDRVATTGTAAVLGAWQHVVGTYSGSSLRIYIDGALNNAVSPTGTRAGVSNLMIGGWNGVNYCDALLTDVAIHTRALNPSEIAQLHAEPYCFFWEPGRRTIFVPLETGGQIISTRRIKRYGMFFSS